MSHIRDAELALVRAIQCGNNGGFCFPVSETDRTLIQSVKEAKDHLDRLLLIQRIEQLKTAATNSSHKIEGATQLFSPEA